MLAKRQTAAIAEGILPGGGTALVRCLPVLKALVDTLDGDVKTGVQIIARALSSPLRQIAYNAGQEGAIILQHVEKLTENMGYNALTGEFVDMIKTGILDPTKVVRTALENAVSIAALLLTTEAIVAELPREEATAAPAGHGMDY